MDAEVHLIQEETLAEGNNINNGAARNIPEKIQMLDILSGA